MITLVYFYALNTYTECNYLLRWYVETIIFSSTCHKIYERLMKNNESNKEISKESNQGEPEKLQ